MHNLACSINSSSLLIVCPNLTISVRCSTYLLFEGYTAQVLTDALVYAEHAGRPGNLQMDDVTLAVQSRVGWEFGGRVPKEVSRPCLALGYRYCRLTLCYSVPSLPRHSYECYSTSRCQ